MHRILAAALLCSLAVMTQAATVGVELSATQKVAGEKAPLTPAVILFKRGSGDPVSGALVVDFAISGTAGRGIDYDLGLTASGTALVGDQITILDGQTSVSLFINPISDAVAEGQETVIVQVLAGASYTPGLSNSIQAPIADDDVDVSLSTPLPLAYEDYTTGPGSVLDPDSNRRGAFRVLLSPARGFSTYVVTELSAVTQVGNAAVGTDYSVVYKIGGSGLGNGLGYSVMPRYILAGTTQVAVTGGSGGIPLGSTIIFGGSGTNHLTTSALSGPTGTISISPALTANLENDVALTVTPNMPTAFRINNTGGHLAGVSTIVVDGGSGPIPAGAHIAFTGDPTDYITNAGLAATSGSLTISPALAFAVADNDPLTVSWPTAISGYTTTGANSEPVDGHSLRLAGGQGGFSPGDVFRIGAAQTPQYRVQSWVGDILTFTVFTGSGGATGGLAGVLTGNPAIVTHFTAAPAGVNGREIQVLVPGASTQVEYGIVPTSDTLAEGIETLSMSLLTSNDFETIPPIAGQMTITDDDVVVYFDPTQSINATEGGIDGSFLIRLSSAFPRNRQIVYQIGGTASPSADMAANDYVALTGTVDIPANSTTGTITVVPNDDGITENIPETVILTLQPTNDYRVVTTVGSTANASAEITINDKMGTVGIAATSGSATGKEHPTTVTTAQFTVTLRNDSGVAVNATENLTVTYSIAGTASAGNDYTTLSGSVVIAQGASSALITVTPVDDTVPETAETVALALTPAQGYTISGSAGSASVSIADDEPVVGVIKTDTAEGGTAGVFTIGYPPPALNRDIIVDLTYGGGAIAGDYVATTADGSPHTQVKIPAGSNSTTVTITPVDDTTPEGDETVIATVSAKPTVYTIGIASATMTIGDNEPVLHIEQIADVTEGDDAETFRVRYPGASVGRDIVVTLTYPTTTATAIAADFTTARPVSVTIPASSNQVLVSLAAKYDGLTEGDETVECTISPNAAVYSLGTASATCEVHDLLPTLTLVGGLAIEEGGTYPVKVISSFKPLTPFTVAYTVSGDATPGAAAGGTADYKTLSGEVVITELETVIQVITFTDTVFDPFEAVVITLDEDDPPSYLKAGSAPLSTAVQILDSKRGVVEVISSDPDRPYTAGEVLLIRVVFTNPVEITGTPTLRLETGASDAVAIYQGLTLDGYEALFSYTVRSTHHSSNLDYVSSTALALHGGTIVNDLDEAMDPTLPAPGNEGSLSFGHNRPIDGGQPDGKPAPGTVGQGASGGGCGLGSGFAALMGLCMLAGFALSVRHIRS